jgi:hypothetical protein
MERWNARSATLTPVVTVKAECEAAVHWPLVVFVELTRNVRLDIRDFPEDGDNDGYQRGSSHRNVHTGRRHSSCKEGTTIWLRALRLMFAEADVANPRRRASNRRQP